MKKLLLLDDKQSLRNEIAENIEKFEVIPTGTITEAIKILKTEKISIIAVDWALGQDETGDMLYDLLFESGKSIPAILFSGNDLSEGTKKFLESKGFSKIISKIDTAEDSISDLLEKEAINILDDCKARVFHVKQKVQHIGNGEMPIKFKEFGKTINEWILELENCLYSEEDEKELKELIIKNCLAYRKRHDEYIFDQI